jgi:hypothetical protein
VAEFLKERELKGRQETWMYIFLAKNLRSVGEWSFSQFLSNLEQETESYYGKGEKAKDTAKKGVGLTEFTPKRESKNRQVSHHGHQYSIGNKVQERSYRNPYVMGMGDMPRDNGMLK